MKILIVEDEKKVSDFVRKGLQEEGYVTDAAYNGEDGLGMAADDVYDLVILDIYLPKIDVSLTRTEEIERKEDKHTGPSPYG